MNMSKASLDTSQTSKNFAKIVKSSEVYSEPSGTSKRELQLLSHKNGNKQFCLFLGIAVAKFKVIKLVLIPGEAFVVQFILKFPAGINTFLQNGLISQDFG